MTRYYSLFVTSDELMASPYVRQFSLSHDFTLEAQKTEKVTFLVQKRLLPHHLDELYLVYNPNNIEVKNIKTQLQRNQIIIEVELTPHEIGSMRLGFSFPEPYPHSFKAYANQMNASQKTEFFARPVTA